MTHSMHLPCLNHLKSIKKKKKSVIMYKAKGAMKPFVAKYLLKRKQAIHKVKLFHKGFVFRARILMHVGHSS